MPANQVAVVTDSGVVKASSNEVLKGLRDLFESRRAALAEAAASHIDPERVFAVVLQTVQRSDDLMRIALTNPLEVYRAVHLASSWGLEPTGSIGGAHLVPYGDRIEVIADYRGLIKLARRSGEVTKVIARVVREKDEFRIEQGTTERLVHVPFLGGDAGAPTHVYTVITLRDGDTQFDWDTWAWVQSIKRRSRASSGPWQTDEVEMAKKSIIRRGLKLAPQAVEVQRVIVDEEEREAEQAQARVPASASSSTNTSGIAAIRERVGIAAAAPDEVVDADAGPTAGAGTEEERSADDLTVVDTATFEEADESLQALVDSEPPVETTAPALAPRQTARTRRKTADPAVDTASAASAAERPSDAATCGAAPPAVMGMTETCTQVGAHRVHRSSEGTWPVEASA